MYIYTDVFYSLRYLFYKVIEIYIVLFGTQGVLIGLPKVTSVAIKMVNSFHYFRRPLSRTFNIRDIRVRIVPK